MEGEAAKFLKISQRNLIRLRNKGTVPYYRIGKSIRYSREKLLAALEVAREVEYAYP
jgi:excisionase family DNA binding protein